MNEQERAHRRVTRRVWSIIGVVALVIACTAIMGLALHIVDSRNARNANGAAVLAAVAEGQYEICVSQVTTATELNAVLDYVKAAALLSSNPGTRAFVNGLPYAKVPTCTPPAQVTATTGP